MRYGCQMSGVINMDAPILNYWAILVSGIASMVLGALWYSPVLFAKPWMKLVGKTKEEINQEMKTRSMPALYIAQFIAALVVAYVLAYFVAYLGARTAWDGIIVGVWAAVGFVLATSFGNYLFENRSMKLFWINNGYILVYLIVAGAILAGWK
jgi:hypothetical protein